MNKVPKPPLRRRPLKVETVQLASLSLDPRNARRHPERNLESVKASLNRFGQQKPIVVDADGVIVAGNGTYAAAEALGWSRSTSCGRSSAGPRPGRSRSPTTGRPSWPSGTRRS